MAIKTEKNGFKFFKSESETRNRGDELAERIMVCPYCGLRGLTFRKLQTRHVCPPGKREHVGHAGLLGKGKCFGF